MRAFPLSAANVFNSLLCIAVPQTLTVQVVDTLIANLKNAVEEVESSKSSEGSTMVALYGLRQSSAIGQNLAGGLAASFADVSYKV